MCPYLQALSSEAVHVDCSGTVILHNIFVTMGSPSAFFYQRASSHVQEGCPGGVAVRTIASTSAAQSGGPMPKTHEERRRQARASAVAVGKEDSSITDQIPLYSKPVGKAEATSYTLLIFAGLTFAGVVLYNAVNELIFQVSNTTWPVLCQA